MEHVKDLMDFDYQGEKIRAFGLGHNIGHSVGWVERSETQQHICVGFRSSTQPTANWDGLKYDQGRAFKANGRGVRRLF